MSVPFPPRRRRLPRAAVLLLPALLGACYTTVPVAGAPAAPRAVRVTLTAEGTRHVEPAFGPFIVALDGRAEGSAGDTLVVRVRRTFHQAGLDETRNGDLVRLAPGHVASVGARRLSVWRTAGVVLLVAGVGIALPGLFGADGGGTGAPGPTPTPP